MGYIDGDTSVTVMVVLTAMGYIDGDTSVTVMGCIDGDGLC